jgi:hypothetical protein
VNLSPAGAFSLPEAIMEDSEDANDPKVLTKTEARQGVTLHAMRQVLIFGTIGAIVGLLAAGLLLG